MSAMQFAGGVSKDDLLKMLGVADERIKLQQQIVDGYQEMINACRQLETDILPKLQPFSTAVPVICDIIGQFSSGVEMILLARMEQERYILAQHQGQRSGVEEAIKLLDSRILRPTHPQRG